MIILAVDDDSERLDSLKSCLLEAFPDADIVAENDPLMAGKYCFSHAVDIAFSGLYLKRLDGIKLEQFVHHSNPDARMYLTGTPEDYEKWKVLSQRKTVRERKITDMVTYPITPEQLRGIVLGQPNIQDE